MKLFSRFPLSMLFFKHWTPDDREVGVAIAKAAFRRYPDGQLRAEPAPELAMEDVFEGDPAWTALIQEQDLSPMKRGTDLTIAAIVRSAEGKPRGEWAVEVGIPDTLHHQFHVRGASAWIPRRKGWERTAPELVNEVPLRYGLAFGGAAPGPDEDMVHHYNPAGIGLVTQDRLAAKEDIPVPQIGLLAEFLSDDPMAEMSVHGLGPIAKAWLPRRAFAGTFDDDWLADRHPRMPADYDLQFWNAAPGPLQVKDGLTGVEVISVSGISETPGPLQTVLPRVWCGLQMFGQERVDQAMVLDTVQLDLTNPDPLEHTATLLWRAQIDQPDRFVEAELVSGRIGEG